MLGYCGSCKAEGKVEDQEHEQWVSKDDGTANRNTASPADWQNWHPHLEQNGCTVGVWIGAHCVDGPSMW